MKKIGFIGAGNMATAIIGGLYKAKLSLKISAYDLDKTKLENLKKYDVFPTSSAKSLVHDINYLLLAVKPQNFSEVLAEIKPVVNHEVVLISIAAGITPDYISSALGYEAKVVQVMPNTPLLLGIGATALSSNSLVSKEEFAFVREIFNCSGITAVIPNNKMNEIIAINSSSPAFIYQFAQYFIDYGKSAGIDESVCLRLFSQALIGSAKMMTESGYSLDKLIQMVSSKGGTTIAGLHALKQNHLDQAVKAACENCTKQAYELAK